MQLPGTTVAHKTRTYGLRSRSRRSLKMITRPGSLRNLKTAVTQWRVDYHRQGRNKVRWSPGQEVWHPSCSNLRSFGSNCTVLKKVLVTLLGLFFTPCSDSASGEMRPPCPPLRPWSQGLSTWGACTPYCGSQSKIETMAGWQNISFSPFILIISKLISRIELLKKVAVSFH